MVHMESFNVDDREDFKDESLYTFCGSCKNHVMTMVTYRVGKMTIVFASALCLLGCLGGCCLVPFLWKRFQDVEHVCPNCQLKLGKYRRPTKNICCKVSVSGFYFRFVLAFFLSCMQDIGNVNSVHCSCVNAEFKVQF